MFPRILLFFVIINLLPACKQAPKYDPALLAGEWKGVDWVLKGKPTGRDARDVRFTFDPTLTYTAAYGEQKESGGFRIEGEKLYTTAEDKIEKVVRIERLAGDTLVLGMNRVGQDEQLILVKQ
jgi:Lipocalin-like domain